MTETVMVARMVKKVVSIFASKSCAGLDGFLLGLWKVESGSECFTEFEDHLSCQRAGFRCSSDCRLDTELTSGMVEPVTPARDALSSQ